MAPRSSRSSVTGKTKASKEKELEELDYGSAQQQLYVNLPPSSGTCTIARVGGGTAVAVVGAG